MRQTRSLRFWSAVRAIIAAVLAVAGLSAVALAASGGRFPNIPVGRVADDVQFGAMEGWWLGYPDGTFQPERQVSDKQVAAVWNRMFPDGLTRGEAAVAARAAYQAVLEHRLGGQVSVASEGGGRFDRALWEVAWPRRVDEALRWRQADCRWAFYARSPEPACLVEPNRDHLVAVGEVFQSGGWRWNEQTRHRFYTDTENLFVLDELENIQKSDFDPAGWMPERNRCEYVERWLEIKSKWQLSVDAAEAEAILAEGCLKGGT